MNLKGKRILITTGPTWVPIDSVRIISNLATGRTGNLLAKALSRKGAKVALISGPISFNELKNKVIKELKGKDYAAVIHSAAVSDYRMQKAHGGKIKSGKRTLRLVLAPTEKIINLIKKIAPGVSLVGFKFEPQATKKRIISEAKDLLEEAKADLVVANTVKNNKYRAYIVSNSKISGPFLTKEKMADALISKI